MVGYGVGYAVGESVVLTQMWLLPSSRYWNLGCAQPTPQLLLSSRRAPLVVKIAFSQMPCGELLVLLQYDGSTLGNTSTLMHATSKSIAGPVDFDGLTYPPGSNN